MANYRYKAKNAQGETVSGTVSAQNETDAVADIRRQGLVVFSLDHKRGGESEPTSPAGEASGQLDTVLLRLAEYQEASAALKAEIKSAMTYPVVSLVMVLGITLFLLVFIIPKFEDMFNTMDVELPAVTKALIATSLFL